MSKERPSPRPPAFPATQQKRSRQRLPLGRSRRRFGYERRVRITLWAFSLPLIALAAVFLLHARAGITGWIGAMCTLLVGWALLYAWIADEMLRPLQTLANVVAALREQDYSFRARGARRGDALGDLALEINALANDLQAERVSSLESAALVRHVLDVLEAPVLAFDAGGVLRLLNPAAGRLLAVRARQALGQHARTLGVDHLLLALDEQVVSVGQGANAGQWVVRRSRFRQHGVPHELLLLADVSQALRQEEREAWRRLIRVLGHEINNSLTPIKSLAGSLRTRLKSDSLQSAGATSAAVSMSDFDRPLAVIEERADSLNRFLSAYRQLAQLAPPRHEPLELGAFLRQLASLETRLSVQLPEIGIEKIMIRADKDQLAQAIINLLRNGAEAALENTARPPMLSMSWSTEGLGVVICVRDSGLGIANPSNLFVPFYTTKQNGTGIGLALVKQIAEAHGGSVALVNCEEGGAAAQLRLPL